MEERGALTISEVGGVGVDRAYPNTTMRPHISRATAGCVTEMLTSVVNNLFPPAQTKFSKS